jgi:hypothetical protein
MKNKNAFLLAEATLKIVIALIALLILVGFLGSLYYNNAKNKDLETAKATLGSLDKWLGEGMGGEDLEVRGPAAIKKWYISSWPYGDIRPKTCSNLGWESCICICKNAGKHLLDMVSVTPKGMANDCDGLGVCIESSDKIIVGTEEDQRPINIVVSKNKLMKLKKINQEDRIKIIKL